MARLMWDDDDLMVVLVDDSAWTEHELWDGTVRPRPPTFEPLRD
ncbi:hypothetical protein ACFPIJ_11505 [Dactylosporangium cerinum]|uniref:Uncharacterized protein n=1 Tax=Dactylosporangium cerinum TaxID=1434730 RepID=A0ABV9VSL9_9ACTN